MAKEQSGNKAKLEAQLAEMKQELENFNLPPEAVAPLKGQIKNTEKQIALEDDIQEMEEIMQDDDTPADRKKILQAGIMEARERLKKLEAEMPTVGKKKAPVKKGAKAKKVTKVKGKEKSSLADCQEIIARYKKQNANKADRIQKRKRQGKPAELTVPETLKKTAKTVEKKVEDQGKGRITIAQQDAAINQIVDIAAAILDGLKPQQYTAFIDKLNKAIRDHLVKPKKAEAGIVLENDGSLPEFGENQTVSGNMRIDSYRTKHFDISPDAQKLFEGLMKETERVGISGDTTHVLRNAADDLDRMLQIVKDVQISGTATRKDFTEAASLTMLFMYWMGKLFDRLPQESNIQNYYPRFLPGYLYTIAMKLPEDNTPEMAAFGKRLLSAVNRDRKYESDQSWERDYKRTGSPKHPHYADKGAKIDINPEYHWFAFNPLKNKIFAGYEFNVDAKELVKEMKEVNPYSKLVVYGSKHLITEMGIDPYDAENWSNSSANCGASIKSMEKGGQIYGHDEHRATLLDDELIDFQVEVSQIADQITDPADEFEKDILAIVGWKTKTEQNEDLNELIHIAGSAIQLCEGIRLQDQSLQERLETQLSALKEVLEEVKIQKARGGFIKSTSKASFKKKVKVISKSLTGKKVPGKKKAAGTAAGRIADAMKKYKGKGVKKAYAGMTMINAPDNSAIAHGGDGVLGTPRN
jgi:hypothetical protein